ncbi:MAG: GNAT family N-acetyltransferase [Syntrophotaleaceae bacterium]
MQAEFISSDDSRWKDLLKIADHDLYHLPEYLSLAARHEGGMPCAFWAETAESVFLVPLLKRVIPADLKSEYSLCDVFTPYGYPGPILNGNHSEKNIEDILQGFFSACRKNGVVSAFWRLHPLLPFPADPLQKLGTLVQHGNTVYIDLSHTPEQMWQETSNNHRRHIKRLREHGFVAVRNEWRYWQSFIDAYRENMDRVSADGFYFFSNRYFEDLRTTFGEKLDLWTVLSAEGDFAGSMLFTMENGIVQYHLGGTMTRYMNFSPNKLIIAEARLCFKKEGHRFLHLGGGLGGATDSLYTYKARFSPLSVPFYTFRAVVIADVYADLTQKRLGKMEAQDSGKMGFFPAYRIPS